MKAKYFFAAISFTLSFLSVQAQSVLYGVTSSGGINGYGTVFSYVVGSTSNTVRASFNGTNGINPTGGLLEARNGLLYGTTINGGPSSLGVLYSFDPATDSLKSLVNFNGTNGSGSYSALIQASDGKIYGMTSGGGTSGGGVLFSFSPITHVYTVLLNFNGTVTGKNPQSSLLQASDGKFYGTTLNGGANNYGVLFCYDPQTTNFTNLYDFDDLSGRSVIGNGMIEGRDGRLFGITDAGGSSGKGVIFAYDNSIPGYTPLFHFNGTTNGGGPRGTMLELANGLIYGTASQGGANGQGVLYSFDTFSSNYIIITNFNGANGATPYGGLVLANDGLLYGTTSAGGTGGNGVLFSCHPMSKAFLTKLSFTTGNGSAPEYGALIPLSPAGLHDQAALNERVNVFPIPCSQNYITLDLKGQGYEQLSICNLQGKELFAKVLEPEFKDRMFQVDLSDLPQGIYFMHLLSQEGTIAKKIVLAR
jgi:uncharacterized repeat protein (TIGR03803 family)